MPGFESDPPIMDWETEPLPDAWPDALSLGRTRELGRVLMRVVRGPRMQVKLPDPLVGADSIPRYALQEFHNLPNGNYSKHVTHGYSGGFDLAMLGVMQKRRAAIANLLKGCSSVLDLGCGAGHTAGAIADAGAPEVWGLDPSPYLLQHAARTHPRVRFVQGIAEETGFGEQRFDGISACFLFHELPPRAIETALREAARVLRPGGHLVVTEPSRDHWQTPARKLLWRDGWRGLYFHALARFVHEPFLASFHAMDFTRLLADCGFEVLREVAALPTTTWIACRQ